ncbi:MAG: lytic transglycosylase domain-containing protein [Treponema sp.]|nr:lytic transglycosylase domain-containing protein [Treponema sp.]
MSRTLILFSLLAFFSCSSVVPQVKSDFYFGLLETETNKKIAYFEKALSSSNEFIRQAAAGELAFLMSRGNEITPQTRTLIRREAHGFWAAALETADNLNREKALAFFLSHELNTPSFNEARAFVLRESARQGLIFTNQELAAINGHHSISRLSHNEALNFFRGFMESNSAARTWPSHLPELFIQHPILINSLGRAFQFTQSGSEGINLFLNWEASLSVALSAELSASLSEAASQNDTSIDENLLNDLRYRLTFFAGRISRRHGGQNNQGLNQQGISFFERALALQKNQDVPNRIQIDACVWYILDMSVNGPHENFINRLEQFIPLWYRPNTFNGVMERFLNRLVTARNWTGIYRVLNLLKDSNANVPRSSYAWITARAIEEGFLSAEDLNRPEHDYLDSLHFARVAYDSSGVIIIPALHYRMESARRLELPFLPTMSENNSPPPPSPRLDFLLGFFRYGAENLALPFVRAMENEMAIYELRATAQAFAAAGMHPQAMRLISLFINREGYTLERRDMEIMFPRPYKELTETAASQFNIPPYLLFGLIRTESAFQSAVVSHAGAVGLTQLMPSTAREMAERIRRTGSHNFLGPGGAVDSTDPFLNIYIGSFYFNHLMSRFNYDKMLVLMAYNGGQGRVRRWLNTNNLPIDLFVETVPIFETRDYGKRVLAVAAIYQALYY